MDEEHSLKKDQIWVNITIAEISINSMMYFLDMNIVFTNCTFTVLKGAASSNLIEFGGSNVYLNSCIFHNLEVFLNGLIWFWGGILNLVFDKCIFREILFHSVGAMIKFTSISNLYIKYCNFLRMTGSSLALIVGLFGNTVQIEKSSFYSINALNSGGIFLFSRKSIVKVFETSFKDIRGKYNGPIALIEANSAILV